MKAHIRYIARRRKGIVTESEKVLDKQSVSIGRATDKDIFLADSGVGLNHARINLLPDGVVSVSSVSRLGFYIEGNLVQNCLIRRSGAITIGTYLITIVINGPRTRVDITVEKLAADIVEMQSARKLPLSLEQTRLSKRQLSWLGFAAVLILFLGLPLAGFHDETAQEIIDFYGLPDDDFWISGDISKPHRHFGSDCNQCHQQPFVKVRDETCLDCHKNINAHADPDLYDLPGLQATRCASCHREHSGSVNLVQTDQNLCSDCHGQLDRITTTDLYSISDFETDHSEFRARLITDPGKKRDNPAAWSRVALDDPALRHETGLVFPHYVHLEPGGVLGPEGRTELGCDDCHQSDASGNYMQPISMEAHCSYCHRLEFDPGDLERELPHSDLPNLRKMLEEYYSLAALRGGVADEVAPDLITQRRRPGKTLTREETEIALQWALAKAEDVAEEVIEFRSCNLCHKVRRDETSELGWEIPPVNTAQDRWLPKGHFAHDQHLITECETCHAASVSHDSEDVLLPGIDVCRECHGGQNSTDLLQSTCIECHNFHQTDGLLLRRTAAMGNQGG